MEILIARDQKSDSNSTWENMWTIRKLFENKAEFISNAFVIKIRNVYGLNHEHVNEILPFKRLQCFEKNYNFKL